MTRLETIALDSTQSTMHTRWKNQALSHTHPLSLPLSSPQRDAKVSELRHKFESTDYTRFGSPEQQLSHMNKDVNEIVKEREKQEREKQAEEDAAWWKEEHAGMHSPPKATRSIGGQSSSATSSAPPKVTIEVKPIDSKPTKLDRAPALTPAFVSSGKGKSDPQLGEISDNLRPNAMTQQWNSSQSNDSIMGRPLKKEAVILTNPSPTSNPKMSLDAAREERRHMWDGFLPLKHDPAANRAQELVNNQRAVPQRTVPQAQIESLVQPKGIVDDASPMQTGGALDRLHTHRAEHEIHDFLDSAASFFGPSKATTVDSTRVFDTSSPLERVLARTSEEQNARSWNMGSTNRPATRPSVLPTDDGGMLHSVSRDARDAKEAVIEKVDDAKETVSTKLGDAKEAVSDKLEDAKEKIVDTRDKIADGLRDSIDSAKSSLVDLKDDAAHRLASAKNTIVDKTDEFTTKLKEAKEDVKEEWSEATDKTKAKLREMKSDIKEKGYDIKEKGREAKEAIKEKGHEIKDDIKEKGHEIKEKGRELKADVKEKGQDLKDRSAELARDVKADVKKAAPVEHPTYAWWNPMGFFRSSPTRDVPIETVPISSPGEQQVNAIHAAPSQNFGGTKDWPGDVNLNHSRSPRMKLPNIPDPVVVPNSLRGLQGGTELPKDAKVDVSPINTNTKTNTVGTNRPVYVPNSLRGLEDTDVPTTSKFIDPEADFRGDLGLYDRSELRPKQKGGIVYGFAHMFDRRESTPQQQQVIRPNELSRDEKLNASARDFWDLRAQESQKVSFADSRRAQSIQSVHPVQSPQIGKLNLVPTTVAIEPKQMQWDLLHDRMFEELLVETME